MTQTATNRVQDTGIAPVTSWVNPETKQIINFVVAGGQDMTSGYVHATPSDYARKMEHRRQDLGLKQHRHYAALQQHTAAAKPGSASAMQARGMKLQNALLLRARPSRYAALKAQPAVTVAAPKAAPMPTAMPQSMVVATGTINARVEQPKQARSNLRLVSSQDAPAAKPKQPTLAERQKYWSRSAGYACTLG